MADVVISYSKRDRDRVRLLVTHLEASGFEVWWDYEIQTGKDWFESILRQIDTSRCVVGVWSDNSVTVDGLFAQNDDGLQYVAIEHRRAARKLAPVLLDAGRIPVEFASFQAANLSGWTGDAKNAEWLRLLERVETLSTPRWASNTLNRLRAELEDEKRSKGAVLVQLARSNESLDAERMKNAAYDGQLELLKSQLSEAHEKLNRMNQGFLLQNSSTPFWARMSWFDGTGFSGHLRKGIRIIPRIAAFGLFGAFTASIWARGYRGDFYFDYASLGIYLALMGWGSGLLNSALAWKHLPAGPKAFAAVVLIPCATIAGLMIIGFFVGLFFYVFDFSFTWHSSDMLVRSAITGAALSVLDGFLVKIILERRRFGLATSFLV